LIRLTKKVLGKFLTERPFLSSQMFRPEANRLCKFFEISALSVSLASRGGYQGKQGYLKILSKSSRKDAQKGVFTPVSWMQSREPKWFIVRESYIAIVPEPDTLQIHDVFLIDGDFAIERPKRLYKQTLHLAQHLKNGDDSEDSNDDDDQEDEEGEDSDADETAVDGSDTRRHSASKEKGKGKFSTINAKSAKANASSKETSKHRRTQSEGQSQGQDQTALLTDGAFKHDSLDRAAAEKKKKARDGRNTSSHTFYIKNAERRLKLVAKNERQMEQFISSMERVAARSIFCGSNRFGSFAPIRLNCSAQWLVDGRDYVSCQSFKNYCRLSSDY